ncbi:Hsp70 family protein [Micromonospora rubida]|uniref:Hsp70 family protein n=1 Tax=Micromonospora rubida TaxID=2697657 RepID=UPI0013780B75|nr:Hsp70 family protein [Micromonospora rubida]NBE80135.1 Hsp70 family protein [Micromonospora rubida]
MYGVGVDLGTSFAAAAMAHSGTLDMVRLGGQAMVTPSAAYLDENGELLTGEAADRLGLQDSSRVAREFKRRLGDPTPVILAGAPHSPTALMAALLRSILDAVSRARGGPPDDIVLTHPAVWGPYRREQFTAIPPLAGLPRPNSPQTEGSPGHPTVRTVTEPVAAATYYCATHPLPPDGLLAVYDLGGGTFDSAVVRNGRGGLEIVGTPEGIEWLGGADFDQAILDHVNRQLGGAINKLDPADPGTAALLAAVQRECVMAKEALSTRLQAEISVPLPDGVRHVTITRDTFEKTINPSLDATVEAFRRTLTNAGITPQDLNAVLLVGGSSQIPRVSEVLRDTLRRPLLINTHPKHAVALGAAMLSADALAMRSTPTAPGPERRTVVAAVLPSDRPETGAAEVEAVPEVSTVLAPVVAAAPVLPSDAPGDAGDGSAEPEQTPTTTIPVRRRPRPRHLLLPAVVVLVATMLAASYVALPDLWNGGPPECGTADVALGRPATASSTEGAGYPAANAVDGDTTSRWSSSTSGDPQWLQVDLGGQVDVCGVSIQWESAHATAFQIQLSTDGTNWTNVHSTTTGEGGRQNLTVSGTGRYLRVHGTARAGGNGYSIRDLDVHTTSGSSAANVALPDAAPSVSVSPTGPAPTRSAPPTPAPSTPGRIESSPKAPTPAKPRPTPSKAVPPGSTSVIRSVATGLCVDSDDNPAMAVNGVALGGHAFARSCYGGASQKWREGPPLSKDPTPGPGWYRLLDELTGFCLDSNHDGTIYTLPCANPNPFQLWQRVAKPRPATGPAPSGTVVAYRNLETGRCISLASSDKKLWTRPCPSGNSWPADMLFRR